LAGELHGPRTVFRAQAAGTEGAAPAGKSPGASRVRKPCCATPITSARQPEFSPPPREFGGRVYRRHRKRHPPSDGEGLPEKKFIAAPRGGCQWGEGGACSECPHMKLNSMEKLYRSMRIARRKSPWTKTCVSVPCAHPAHVGDELEWWSRRFRRQLPSCFDDSRVGRRKQRLPTYHV